MTAILFVPFATVGGSPKIINIDTDNIVPPPASVFTKPTMSPEQIRITTCHHDVMPMEMSANVAYRIIFSCLPDKYEFKFERTITNLFCIASLDAYPTCGRRIVFGASSNGYFSGKGGSLS